MKHERQRLAQRELEERIPRGHRGSAQNAFRMKFNAWRLHGLSFEESSARAAEAVRRWFDPAFSPQVLPPRTDAPPPAEVAGFSFPVRIVQTQPSPASSD